MVGGASAHCQFNSVSTTGQNPLFRNSGICLRVLKGPKSARPHPCLRWHASGDIDWIAGQQKALIHCARRHPMGQNPVPLRIGALRSAAGAPLLDPVRVVPAEAERPAPSPATRTRACAMMTAHVFSDSGLRAARPLRVDAPPPLHPALGAPRAPRGTAAVWAHGGYRGGLTTVRLVRWTVSASLV